MSSRTPRDYECTRSSYFSRISSSFLLEAEENLIPYVCMLRSAAQWNVTHSFLHFSNTLRHVLFPHHLFYYAETTGDVRLTFISLYFVNRPMLYHSWGVLFGCMHDMNIFMNCIFCEYFKICRRNHLIRYLNFDYNSGGFYGAIICRNIQLFRYFYARKFTWPCWDRRGKDGKNWLK